jgi:hypothetical protein
MRTWRRRHCPASLKNSSHFSLARLFFDALNSRLSFLLRLLDSCVQLVARSRDREWGRGTGCPAQTGTWRRRSSTLLWAISTFLRRSFPASGSCPGRSAVCRRRFGADPRSFGLFPREIRGSFPNLRRRFPKLGGWLPKIRGLVTLPGVSTTLVSDAGSRNVRFKPFKGFSRSSFKSSWQSQAHLLGNKD